MEETRAEEAVEMLGALFHEQDIVLFRPIETWTEGDRKQNRVDYRNTRYCPAEPRRLREVVLSLLRESASKRLNLFYGVCPRLGGDGRFDQAWQIRTARAVWSDIDHTDTEGALRSIDRAGLPRPSIVVDSGNGVHVYWLLDAPYQITDAGPPAAVETEKGEPPGVPRKSRKYLDIDGERVYLDERRALTRPSPMALHYQSVLAGVADAIGGDKTTDLSRLLRLPGSLNRKDERNGRKPKKSRLVRCDASLKYPLAEFEGGKRAPEGAGADSTHAVSLPQVPSRLFGVRPEKLQRLITASATSPAGQRSEADFALCCYAIRQGMARETLWGLVSGVGKFAERGRGYFDHTWRNAQNEIGRSGRTSVRAGRVSQPENPPKEHSGERTIVIKPSEMRVNEVLRQITDCMIDAGDFFRRAGQVVRVGGGRVSVLPGPAELSGVMSECCEFLYQERGDAEQYKPLTSPYATAWLNNQRELERLPELKVFTRCPVYTPDWRLASPGYDRASGIYYDGPPVEEQSSTERIDSLLQDFCFQSRADRTNYVGMLLTALLTPRFVGSKPALLLNGNQPGLGKSVLAQLVAILRDGQPSETATYNRNDEEFEKRIAAMVRRGATTIIVDNAKSGGRSSRIESPCLERSLTDPVLSFRLLGQSQEIRAENSHLICITANAPQVSCDLVTRSCVVNLHYEGAPERRRFVIPDIEAYAQQHRMALLGELVGMIERWREADKPLADLSSRFNKRGWANTIGGILGANDRPGFLANAGDASLRLDETRREFVELVTILADRHGGAPMPAQALVELCVRNRVLCADLGGGNERSRTTRFGAIASRYVDERFELGDGRTARFERTTGRKGKLYQVAIEKTPDLPAAAEPLPHPPASEVRHA